MNLAAVHEFGRRKAKINTHMFLNLYHSLSLPLFYLLGVDTHLKSALHSLNLTSQYGTFKVLQGEVNKKIRSEMGEYGI